MSDLVDVTTVTDTSAALHVDGDAYYFEGLTPDRDADRLGVGFRTLPTPSGTLRSRFGTVNDLHHGEQECGRLGDHAEGPILRQEPRELPYAWLMNHGAAADMDDADLDAVIVKGDLTSDGTDEEFEAFETEYRPRFGDRLHVVRGNHDAYRGQDRYAGDQWIELPGLTVALLDTVIPHASTGTLRAEQIDWLDAHVRVSTSPVIVMGHHQQWVSGNRSDDYFGLHPDASDALDELAARHPAVIAYTAGHTHRHRVRHMRCGVPTIEVGCVKDFPGTWAEYRVYDGGVMQVVHRIGAPSALRWSERCRVLYSDFGVDYATYALGSLEDRCFNIPLR
jgi:3',5'-cyclic-AMP phosphodiesterase